METTCIIRHFDDHGEPIPIRDRHEPVAIGGDGFEAIVSAILPPFVGALTDEDELAQLNIIAITRDAGLGDCLMMMPTVLKLRKMFPGLWIHLFVPGWTLGIMEWAAADDEMITVYPTEDHHVDRYVKTVDLSWYVERQPVELQAELDRIGLFGRAFGIEFTSFEKRWHLRVPSGNGAATLPQDKPIVMLGLEAAAPHRAPTLRLSRRIGKAVLRRGGRLVLRTRLAPSPDLRQSFSLNGANVHTSFGEDLTKAARMIELEVGCLVCGDTGLYHLAGALGVPFVAIFGAIPPETRLSGYHNYACFSAKDVLDCVPCLEAPCHWRCQPDAPCMDVDALDAEAIAEKAMIFAERRLKQTKETEDHATRDVS